MQKYIYWKVKKLYPTKNRMDRVNITVSKPLLEDVDEIARMKLEDRSTTIRQLLHMAIQEERIRMAIDLYKNQRTTLRGAAKLSNLDYWEFQNEMAKRGVPLMSSLSLVEEQIISVKKRLSYI